MNHYFIKPFRRPNNDCYYFICENEYSKNLYKIERDYVMSPSDRKKSFNRNSISNFLKESENIITKILSDKYCTNWERRYINYINDVYRRRIFRITEESDINYSKYYKYTYKQKNQIYSVVKDRLKDLQTLYFIFKKVKEA